VKSSISLHLGLVIRNLRQQAGMSQVVFAERCGFYQTYLSRIENGRANPTINAIEVIANSLGISVFELFNLLQKQIEAE
jgi:transcriptional regulator with XRE-family HTH domain